jgi:murein DD-endopeptidase MepM/ murein hydrolase activator NlpD
LGPNPPKRDAWRNLIGVATLVASLSVAAGAAASGGGGVGGVGAPDPPKVKDVQCIKTCAGIRTATAGSKVALTGDHLGHTVTVTFAQQGGGVLRVDPTSSRKHSVKAKVPDGAKSGTPKAIDSAGNGSVSPKRLEIVAPEQIPEGGDFKLDTAKADPNKAFWQSKRDARVKYSFEGAATDVQIQVVHSKDGKVVASWVQRDRQPYVENRAKWDGKRDGGGEPRNGRYKFKIGSVSGGGTESTHGSHFGFYDHIFPVRGHHEYWDGFGAPRDGHRHMGQDVGAKCGTKLVAARAGKVQWKAYQSAAGNYVVIDSKHDDHDFMYAHLKRPASVHRGDHLRTGEKIGIVGSTGDATACHLHFEYWKDDWYNGGRALPSVTKALKRWDSWS